MHLFPNSKEDAICDDLLLFSQLNMPVDQQLTHLSQLATNDDNIQSKKQTEPVTTARSTRLSNSSNKPKGRPTKKNKTLGFPQKLSTSCFTEHQKTMLSLAICYPYKALKNHQKLSKYGFLHQKIAKQDDFYTSLKQAIQCNIYFEDNKTSNYVVFVLQKNVQFTTFLDKIIWLGPCQIVDQLLYCISQILQKFIELKKRNRNLDEIKQVNDNICNFAAVFAQQHKKCLWDKLNYITFKNSKLKILQEQFELIFGEFTIFIEIFAACTILAYQKRLQNPYLVYLYSTQYFNIPQKSIKSLTIRTICEKASESPQQIQPEIKKKVKAEESKQIPYIKSNPKQELKIIVQNYQNDLDSDEQVYLGDEYY